VDGDAYRDNYDEIFRKDANDIVCPHCGSDKDPFFSRIEPMGYYCRDCGEECA
jgi:ribosomal protein L37AE/L43A